MTARLTFLAITAFWLTMNGWLWQAEYGSRAGEVSVPPMLVWHKILTAPDASSLSVYQKKERTGYCEISTAVGQEMSQYTGRTAPPSGMIQRAGYQLHLTGNVAFGDFTNRLKFDGWIRFRNLSDWQEIHLRLATHAVKVEIHSVATNRMFELKISANGAEMQRRLPFGDLQDPKLLISALAGNFAGSLLDTMELPDFTEMSSSMQRLRWTACRTRVRIGRQMVPIYRLQSTLLGRDIRVDVGTLGEVLSVKFPGDVNAQIDEWRRP